MYIKKKNSSSCGEMCREENAELFGLSIRALQPWGSVQDPKWQDPIETN